jgi:23S rRNA (cytidine1920-2'-O)/16S rRNA (cytidine1409-2'-O)-methyltransferase
VVCYESADARELEFLKNKWTFNFVVVDVSFISVLKVLPSIKKLNFEKAEALLLIKPQFEVGKSSVGKGGLVESPELLLGCQKQVFDALKEMSLEVLDYFPSSVKGKNGNQEFFCYICL